ncbi:MAG: ferritin-like domain-containing protein [Bacteroidota bacterium]|nr:ferritin-like domain-containing protein [Bacteroidota bacterium]
MYANWVLSDAGPFDNSCHRQSAIVFDRQDMFLTIANAFEDTGFRTYKGQAANLLGTDALALASTFTPRESTPIPSTICLFLKLEGPAACRLLHLTGFYRITLRNA